MDWDGELMSIRSNIVVVDELRPIIAGFVEPRYGFGSIFAFYKFERPERPVAIVIDRLPIETCVGTYDLARGTRLDSECQVVVCIRADVFGRNRDNFQMGKLRTLAFRLHIALVQ